MTFSSVFNLAGRDEAKQHFFCLARMKPLCILPGVMPETLSPEVKNYLRSIAARGGKAQKGSPARRELNRKAAQIRWRKVHPVPKKVS